MLPKSIWMVILSMLMAQHRTIACWEDINTEHRNIILSSINNSVVPCEDFYDFACGNYAKLHNSTDYQEITSLMDHQYNNIVFNLIDSLYQHDHQVPAKCQSFVEKTRVYLKACRRETNRNLKRYFEELKPGPQLDWPILQFKAIKKSKRNLWPADTDFDIWSLLGKLQSYGLNNVFINQEILVDSDGAISIMMEPAFIENNSNSTLPDPSILFVLLKALGVDKPQLFIRDLLQTDKELLDILEKHGDTNEESKEITYNEFQLKYPNLVVFLSELFRHQLPADSIILLRNPDYLQHLNDLGYQGSLKKHLLCNYLMMKFLFYLAKDSTADFKALDCVKDLRNKMDVAVNFLYYYHIYAKNADLYNPAVYELFKSIIDMMGTNFHNNRLNLTESQIQFLMDKLYKIRLNIGNLPDDLTFEKVEEFYENIPDLDKHNYYKNHLLLLRHRFDKSLSYAQNETHYIVADNRLGSSSGAFYVAKQNMIILPFGSLVRPLYDVGYHDLYKYSLLGFILAHEITHAFDTTGLNFDGFGDTLEDDNNILENENFNNSLQCLNSQLETDSIDERMADILAIDVIYKIYISKFNNMTPASVKSTWNRDFYLNLAQFFCGKSNVRFIDHDTDAQRLHQIVINSEGFAQAFSCAGNTTMNPSERCTVY
ncbi:endothelin-converting enzyme homolog [Calliphora vicina]|uniref:endothelin-converting enzyme homolog n=1 Tax=Calliphora vicina TaxID=7373 RepID=UPI00325C0F08